MVDWKAVCCLSLGLWSYHRMRVSMDGALASADPWSIAGAIAFGAVSVVAMVYHETLLSRLYGKDAKGKSSGGPLLLHAGMSVVFPKGWTYRSISSTEQLGDRQ